MIRTERRGRVALITIDRPERRNAVDAEHLDALREAVLDTGDARAVVLTGAGGTFCAGADLTAVEDRRSAAGVRRTLDALAGLERCTVAAVDGPALGAGTQLAVACDLRVVTERARFGIPAAKLGLMVDQWTVERVANLAGHAPARAMLLAAETIGADAALASGFAQRRGTLDDAISWAGEIAALAPLSVAGHKAALDALAVKDRMDPAVQGLFDEVWASQDRREGISAFAERRPPRFTGR